MKCALVITFLLFLVGCTGKQSDTATSTSQPAAQFDPATVARISGIVKFEGAVPSPQKIDMAQDPACGNEPAFDESLIVNNGNLENVFVYLKRESKGGLTMLRAPTISVIEQRGCRYRPHVVAIMAGDSVRIENHDETTHNIHPMPKESKQWNESQLPKADPIVKTFTHPEVMIPIKCNQHPWMKMYLNVSPTPWFAVTGPDGNFELPNVPPGDYTLVAVHEKLGEQDMKVTVGPKETKAGDFTFRSQ